MLIALLCILRRKYKNIIMKYMNKLVFKGIVIML